MLRFTTLAIGAPYRRRARLLLGSLVQFPCTVLTDKPDDFMEQPWVDAYKHVPVGPMASNYDQRVPWGQRAYHDKRFAVQTALEDSKTAVFLDADVSVCGDWPVLSYPEGLALYPQQRESVAGHLFKNGPGRKKTFAELARSLGCSLDTATWCGWESCYAVTKDAAGGWEKFFEAWSFGATFMAARGLHSGEGGVMGLAAATAGWIPDVSTLEPLKKVVRHTQGVKR